MTLLASRIIIDAMKVIIIAALLIALVGSGAFFLLRKNSQSAQDTSKTLNLNTTQNAGGNLPSAEVTIAREVTIEASEYKFSPSEIRVRKGETVKITLKNIGKMSHNWMVEKMGGASIDTTEPGKSSTITITPSQTGTFTTFCSIGNHRKLGMVGKLIVE